jgi:predicted unusual protein kinase regulating ubiquinone biosynthesis (AarF/ABC1/UbiB family)
MASPHTTPQTVVEFPDRFSNHLPDPSQPIDVEFIEKPNPNLLPGAGQELLEDNPQNKYDPEAIAAHYQQRPFAVLRRFLKTLLPLVFFYINLWWDKVTNQRQQKERDRAVQLRKIVTKLGPAYIKVGQALSTRPDLLPVIFIEELSTLQDQLPPFPNSVAFQFIEEELNASPYELYAEISPQPVAAASLGQVYKGKLKTGETVAIKVQRPGLEENIALDIYILRGLAGWAERNIPRVKSDLVGIMDEFGERIFEELDYSLEGRNAEKFARLYGHLPDIYVPKIYWDFTHERVLTMEWIEGTKLTNMQAIAAQGIDARHLVEMGVQCSLRQLLEHGFFHADPHPGNLLATKDGKLAYLDFGMMSQVKPYQRYGLIEAVVHLVNRDFSGLAQDYIKLDFLTPDTDLTPIIPALADVFNDALGATVAELNFKSITDKLSNLMYEYPFRVPAYYALIIRSLVTLEGIAINVDPNFKVLSKAYPYIAKRLLTDQAPQLRNSLQELLFKDGSFRWNRLENLLKNASDSQDYQLSQVLDQTVEFLFSPRGDFIREQLVEEIIKAVDLQGRKNWDDFTDIVRTNLGMGGKKTGVYRQPEAPSSLDNIKRIWDILQTTPGFDSMQVISLLPKLLVKQETQQMGQQIASGLAQRALARVIREVLAPPERDGKTLSNSNSRPNPQLVLPTRR